MEIKNPFLLHTYIAPEYFCDRDKESTRMVQAIDGGRHLTLISARRMGKTGLVKHVFYKLQRDKSYACFYLDIQATNSLNEFLKLMADAIIGKLDSIPVKALKLAVNVFSNLKPTISIDSLTGEPSVEFDIIKKGKQKETLKEILDYLAKQKKHIVIAIDEFQQVQDYEEKNIEELLRSHFMQVKNVTFVFSGSNTHILSEMFGTQNRPFFRSTEIMYLDKIPAVAYKKFIARHFEKASKKISEDGLEYILEFTRTHTWYVQMLCNKLYFLPQKKYSLQDVKDICFEILKENEPVYFNFRNMLSDPQWKLLIAVAKEQQATKPTGQEFIHKHHLGAQSTVQRSLQSLIQKQMLTQTESGYHLPDVFLSRWMERLP